MEEKYADQSISLIYVSSKFKLLTFHPMFPTNLLRLKLELASQILVTNESTGNTKLLNLKVTLPLHPPS